MNINIKIVIGRSDKKIIEILKCDPQKQLKYEAVCQALHQKNEKP